MQLRFVLQLQCGAEEHCCYTVRHDGGGSSSSSSGRDESGGASSSSSINGTGGSSSAELVPGSCEEYSEVQLVVRVPRPAGGGGTAAHPEYGSVDDMARLIEQLQGQLQLKDRECQAAVAALSRRVRLTLAVARAPLLSPAGCAQLDGAA